jgi:hypothetical protein
VKEKLNIKPVYGDDAYAYLKGLLEKSNIFHEEAEKIRRKHGKAVKASLLQEPEFIKLLKRFKVPGWLYGQIATYVRHNGKTDFLSDQIICDDPCLEARSNGKRLVPHVLFSIPINITRQDLKLCWEIVEKKRTQCEGVFWNGRTFMNKNALWRTEWQFDLAFTFYELTRIKKMQPNEALEEMRTSTLLPARSKIIKFLELDYIANMQKLARKIQRQIAALQLTQKLTRAPQKQLRDSPSRY